MRLSAISAIFILFSKGLLAQTGDSIYQLDPYSKFHNLEEQSYVFVDETKVFSAGDIVEGAADSLFRPLKHINSTFPAYRNCWIKFTIESKETFQKWWLLLRDSTWAASSASVDIIRIYRKRQPEVFGENGIYIPRSKKSVRKNAGFTGIEMGMMTNETATFYVQLYNYFGSNYTIPYPVIQSPELPLPSHPLSNMLEILTAIAIIFSILSIFFYFFVREKSYLVFAIYTFLLSQHYLLLHPDLHFLELYLPEQPQLYVSVFHLLGYSSIAVFILFGKYFINLKTIAPGTDRFVRIFLWCWFATIIFEFFWSAATHTDLLDPYYAYLALLIILALLIRLIALPTMLARIYVTGALWLMIFTILGFMLGTGLQLPFNPWPIGQVGQMLIFGAGLAYKVRLNEKARAEAERVREMESMKSRFFANISHEFRTPLTLIQGHLQQAEEKSVNNNDSGTITLPQRHLSVIKRNADRLLELVNQLLDLSRLEAGSMKLSVQRADVFQTLKTMAMGFGPMAERKSIHFHQQIPESQELVWFDRDKLDKIVSNLLLNAFKYTPENGSVSFSAALEGERLRVTVTDSGPGIGKKDIEKIFDRFYRVEESDGKGTGIGLSLVRELTELCKGQITLQSEPGKGSSFRVSIPVSESAFKDAEKQAAQISSGKTEPEKQSDEFLNESILPLMLVVEDNTELRIFISEILNGQFRVLTASNGEEGFNLALKEVPDIIISDRMMPGTDGMKLLERIRKNEATSHIPFIMLTAKVSNESKLEGLETGADDYIAKPFNARELLTRSLNLVEQRRLLRRKFAGEIILKPSEVSARSIDREFLEKLMNAIEKKMDDDEFGVEELASVMAMSRSQLHRKLVALTGQTPSELLKMTRLLKARDLLKQKAATPSEVAFMVGFNSHSYFSKCFREEFGLSPSEV